ncbi:IS200/IS605 family transposase [Ancylomarina sp. 16SWW S1-10-2]|uniref:IS200/IS605 family transposase n=1 Tax=Ancylomarina sp. 16SWW S1-10-2 TaxID=2499681 RepID=UPI0012AD7D38|nr:IS200/IS605 family transposase [Ancylomarina sp. 16SWW S1-10-2]MRT94042.1 IS200/IS605 family transposase [Ancylomarina sp. 16SWW S1-10-2]
MGNTYSQIYVHLVFAVRNRRGLIHKSWKKDLEKYITGIVQNNGHKLIAIGSMPDHIHIFIGYNMNQTIPVLVEQIKTSSNQWVKDKGFSMANFSWQNGYGTFSYSRSQIDTIANYVRNQEEHHRKKSFKEEYLEILQKFDVEYQDKYLFDFFEESD